MKKMSLSSFCMSAAFMVASLPGISVAAPTVATTTWKADDQGNYSGLFNDPGHWDNGLPRDLMSARFTPDASYEVTMPDPVGAAPYETRSSFLRAGGQQQDPDLQLDEHGLLHAIGER